MRILAKLAILFLLISSIAACQKEDAIRPSQDQELSTFLKENSSIITRYGYSMEKIENSMCMLINSMNEFREIASTDGISTEVPVVDFDSYTLVVGYIMTPSSGFWISDQKMTVKLGIPTITLSIRKIDGIVQPAGTPVPFWGLYPKLIQKTARVEAHFD